MTSTDETEEMIAYLLGELSADRAEEIEEKFFADGEQHDALEAVESELYGDYAAGQLSERRMGLFRERYLQSEAGLERLHFSKALEVVAMGLVPDSHTQTAAQPVGKSPWWRLSFALGTGALVAAFVLLLLLFPQQSGGPKEASLALVAQSQRGDQAVALLPVAQKVFLELAVELQGEVAVRLLQGERELSPPSFERRPGSLIVTIAPATLQDGIYELELSVVEAGQRMVHGYYSFQKGAALH